MKWGYHHFRIQSSHGLRHRFFCSKAQRWGFSHRWGMKSFQYLGDWWKNILGARGAAQTGFFPWFSGRPPKAIKRNNMEAPKNGGGWKMMFLLSKRVIFLTVPCLFSGVYDNIATAALFWTAGCLDLKELLDTQTLPTTFPRTSTFLVPEIHGYFAGDFSEKLLEICLVELFWIWVTTSYPEKKIPKLIHPGMRVFTFPRM